MSNAIERLKVLSEKLPAHLSRAHAMEAEQDHGTHGGLIAGLLGLLEISANPVAEVRKILGSREMKKLILANRVTVGMIKPRLDLHLDKAKAQVNFDTDAELTDFLMDKIKRPLVPVIAVSFMMDDNKLNEFYGGNPKNKKRYEKTAKYRMENSPGDSEGKTRWDEFREMMLAGPVTMFLLASDDNNAVEEWRAQMGPSWDVTKALPYQLRYLAKSNVSNMSHGSESTKAALTECLFMMHQLN